MGWRRILSALCALALWSGPAGADHLGNRAESGSMAGRLLVGKSIASGECTNAAQTLVPGGAGVGMPVVHTVNKFGWWAIHLAGSDGSVTSGGHGAGVFHACGRLEPLLKLGDVPVGADCLTSSGHSGFGRLTFSGMDLRLVDMHWDVSASGSPILVGRVAEGADKMPAGHFVALLQSVPQGACSDKNTDKSSGGQGANQADFVGSWGVQ